MKAFTFALFSFFFIKSANAVETYHLRCRGGGTHEFQLYAGVYTSWFTMHFKRSTGTWIAPGQCSWDDRPVNAQEPTRICQHQSYPTGAFDISIFSNYEGRATILPVTANVQWVKKMFYDNQYQSFYVANNTALQCLDIYAFD